MNSGHAGGQGGRQHGRPRFEPTKLIEIVEIGKQMLMTRGALTTFSIANDIAVLRHHPGLRGHSPRLKALDIMHLASRLGHPVGRDLQCLIIVVLIPLALKGVQYRAIGAASCCAATC
jgi:K+-transporting ATPase ATPase B chain